MAKRDYEYLEECFDKLLDDYNYTKTEIKELKETIDILKALCLSHGIKLSEPKESIPF